MSRSTKAHLALTWSPIARPSLAAPRGRDQCVDARAEVPARSGLPPRRGLEVLDRASDFDAAGGVASSGRTLFDRRVSHA